MLHHDDPDAARDIVYPDATIFFSPCAETVIGAHQATYLKKSRRNKNDTGSKWVRELGLPREEMRGGDVRGLDLRECGRGF